MKKFARTTKLVSENEAKNSITQSPQPNPSTLIFLNSKNSSGRDTVFQCCLKCKSKQPNPPLPPITTTKKSNPNRQVEWLTPLRAWEAEGENCSKFESSSVPAQSTKKDCLKKKVSEVVGKPGGPFVNRSSPKHSLGAGPRRRRVKHGSDSLGLGVSWESGHMAGKVERS